LKQVHTELNVTATVMALRPSPIIATNSSKQGNKSTGGSLEIRKAVAQRLNLHVCMKDRPKMSMVTQQQLTTVNKASCKECSLLWI